MRTSQTCIKCLKTDVIKIPTSMFDSYPLTYIGVHAITTSKFICNHCGYVEQYVEDKKNLERLKTKFGSDDSFQEFV